MCLHSCSVLYGGAYGPRRYVCPKVCGGSAFTWEESRARALGEAVERFCAAVYDERTFVLDCQRNLAPEAIDPSTVALFSAAQYREPGFAFQPFTEETRVAWTWGYSLLRRAPVLVPAAFVYRPYWPIEDEAAIGDFPTTGLACGNSLADAILHGLYETVERDAIMITWLNRLPARRIGLDRLAPAIDADLPWARLGRRGLFVHDITTDIAIPDAAGRVDRPVRSSCIRDGRRGRSRRSRSGLGESGCGSALPSAGRRARRGILGGP